MALANVIESLPALKYLTLKLENEKLTDETLNKFSDMFNNISSLCSFELHFSGFDMKNYEKLFKALRHMKNTNKVRLRFPYSDRNEQILRDLDKRKM